MIYIAIGSNLGNRLGNIHQALQLLTESGFEIVQQSPIIENKAILPADALAEWDQPFLNMVVAGNTTQSLDALLHTLKHIEQQLGRDLNAPRWSPRMMDLDMLMAGDQQLKTPHYCVPHPELLNRPFLIHLLALMAPELKHPQTQQTFSAIAYATAGMDDCYLQSLVATPKWVGIVNVTPDSFSDGGQFFAADNAIKQVRTLHAAGASVIDIGAQSTNPKAQIISVTEEYQRLKPVLDALTPIIKEKNIRISIDSFSDETVKACLDHYPIAWINDVKGALSDACLREIARQGCQLVAMHSLSIPPNQNQVIPLSVSPIETLCTWAEQKINHLLDCGFTRSQIILDPGIGFGKTPYQNMALIKEIAQLKSFGCALLVGHSRKSFMNVWNHLPADQRDIETLALSHYLAKQGVDYLRVHNLRDHQRFFVADISL